MNSLEKIKELLARDGRNIVFGQPSAIETGDVISISVGDSDPSVGCLGENGRIVYTTVDISVYATDYITGYNTLLAVKNEIFAAVKSTVNIVFQRFAESEYDATLVRHVLKSQYKIIE